MLSPEAKQHQQGRLDEFQKDVFLLIPENHERQRLMQMIDVTRGYIRAKTYPYHLFDQLTKALYPLPSERPFASK